MIYVQDLIFSPLDRTAPVLAVGALPVPLERVFEMKGLGLIGPGNG